MAIVDDLADIEASWQGLVGDLPHSTNPGNSAASDDHRAKAEMMLVEQEAENSSIVFFRDNQK